MHSESRSQLVARVLSRIRIPSEEECWVWQGPLTKWGYGEFHMEGRHIRVHRWIYETLIGPVPDGLFVCHACDNKACVNPLHLFLGTPAENSADMVAKGRSQDAAGAANNAAKRTDVQVRIILGMLQAGHKGKDIATRFGISQSTVSEIKHRKLWGHLQ